MKAATRPGALGTRRWRELPEMAARNERPEAAHGRINPHQTHSRAPLA